MSTTQTTQTRVPERLVGGAVAALVAAVIVSGLMADTREQPEARRAQPGGAPTEEPSRAPIKQARWRIVAYPAGVPRLMTKKDARAVKAQRTRIAVLVRDVYDALLLDRAKRKRMLRARFTRPAGRALRRSVRVGLPAGATRVKTVYRKARVGIDALGARRAVASVTVRARARMSGRRVRVLHRSTLWLQRGGGRWRVFAFEARQRPLRS